MLSATSLCCNYIFEIRKSPCSLSYFPCWCWLFLTVCDILHFPAELFVHTVLLCFVDTKGDPTSGGGERTGKGGRGRGEGISAPQTSICCLHILEMRKAARRIPCLCLYSIISRWRSGPADNAKGRIGGWDRSKMKKHADVCHISERARERESVCVCNRQKLGQMRVHARARVLSLSLSQERIRD